MAGAAQVGRASRRHPPAIQPMIEHDAARNRFVSQLSGGEAYLAYSKAGDGTLDLQHTIVPEAERGRGVGESLVRAAVDHARSEGVRIIPSCPFVQAWLDDHPEGNDVVSSR
jgi:predicted GNAT family acetyltransferase